MHHQSFTLPPAVAARIGEFADELPDLLTEVQSLYNFAPSGFSHLLLSRVADEIEDSRDFLKKSLKTREHLAPALLERTGREFADMAAFLNCLAERSEPAMRTALTGFARHLAEQGETARHLMHTTLDGE